MSTTMYNSYVNSCGGGNTATIQELDRKNKLQCILATFNSKRIFLHFLNPYRCSFYTSASASTHCISNYYCYYYYYHYMCTYHIMLSFALSSIHSDVCTTNKSIIIRSCFTVNRRQGQGENGCARNRDHKNKYTKPLSKRIRECNFILCHITSCVCLHDCLYLSTFFFVSSKSHFFLKFSYLAKWMCVCSYGNAICYLPSQTVTYISFRGNQCTHWAMHAHYASCYFKSKCTCHLK